MIFNTMTSPQSHLRIEYPIEPPKMKLPVTNYGRQLGRKGAKETGEKGKGDVLNLLLLHDEDVSNYCLSGSSMVSLQDSSSVSSPGGSCPKEVSVSPSTSVGSRGNNSSLQLDIRSDSDEALSKQNYSKLVSENNQDDYLRLIEPYPVLPPSYSSLPPGGCPKYPIMSEPRIDRLPEYTPAAYKICVVARKVEWLTPYEVSPSRAWKHVILELNSTQLNVYNIPTGSESALLMFQQMPSSKCRSDAEREMMETSAYDSHFTENSDLQLRDLCLRLGLIDSLPCDSLTNYSGGEENSKPRRSKKKLIRSYSLQHAKVGLASDYKKREHVLRLRLESEQLLISFDSVKDLIDWNSALNVGKDVSIDVEQREIPKYRTVPRRRNRQQASRSRSASNAANYSGVKGKIKKLKSKLSFSVDNQQQNSSQSSKSSNQNSVFEGSRSLSNPSLASLTETLESLIDEEDNNNTNNTGRHVRSVSFSIPGGNTHPNDAGNAADEEDDDDDINNISDLHQSDFEEDEDFGEEIDTENDNDAFNTRSRRGTIPSLWAGEDNKWNPHPEKGYSQRRAYRNCLRCIKSLPFDETWANRILVRPVNITPFSLSYYEASRQWKNRTTSRESSISSISSLNSTFSNAYAANSRKRSFSLKDLNGLNFYDSLAITPNHNLKEFVVGVNGLIPKGFQN